MLEEHSFEDIFTAMRIVKRFKEHVPGIADDILSAVISPYSLQSVDEAMEKEIKNL